MRQPWPTRDQEASAEVLTASNSLATSRGSGPCPESNRGQGSGVLLDPSQVEQLGARITTDASAVAIEGCAAPPDADPSRRVQWR